MFFDRIYENPGTVRVSRFPLAHGVPAGSLSVMYRVTCRPRVHLANFRERTHENPQVFRLYVREINGNNHARSTSMTEIAAACVYKHVCNQMVFFLLLFCLSTRMFKI